MQAISKKFSLYVYINMCVCVSRVVFYRFVDSSPSSGNALCVHERVSESTPDDLDALVWYEVTTSRTCPLCYSGGGTLSTLSVLLPVSFTPTRPFELGSVGPLSRCR